MDRKLLKSQAKGLIRTADPKPVYMAIIYLVIISVLSFLSFKIVGGYTDAISSQFSDSFIVDEHGEFVPSVDPEQYYYALQEAMPTPAESLLNIAISIVTTMLGAGFIIFALRTLSGSGASYWNIFDGFGMFFRIIWLDILQTVFITLWSLLLVVPGIIAAYRYRLALYLLLDHPEMSAMDCIRESKRIMSGNKGQLFVLDLSFIGWWILAGIPIVGLFVRVWVVPYTQMTYALYYTTLTGTNAPGAIPGDGSAQDEPHEEHPWEN